MFDFLQSRPALEKTNVRCDAPARTRRKRVLTAGSDTFECQTKAEFLRTAGAGECRIEPVCPAACQCIDLTADCSKVGFTDAQLLPPYFSLPSYIQQVDLSNNNLASFPGHLLQNSDIRKLILRNNQITSLNEKNINVTSSILLNELDLSQNEITSIHPGAFHYFTQLSKL